MGLHIATVFGLISTVNDHISHKIVYYVVSSGRLIGPSVAETQVLKDEDKT